MLSLVTVSLQVFYPYVRKCNFLQGGLVIVNFPSIYTILRFFLPFADDTLYHVNYTLCREVLYNLHYDPCPFCRNFRFLYNIEHLHETLM